MTNDDFRQKFEQHRKEIAVTDDADDLDKPVTRAELHGRKEPSAKKKQKAGKATGKKKRPKGSALINTLLILFMLIPISLFIYVYKFYDPIEGGSAAELEQNLEIETSVAGDGAEPPEEAAVIADQEEKQKLEEQKQQEEQQILEEQKKLEEQQKLEQQKKLEEQKRLEEQKQQEEQKRLAEQQRIEEQKRKDEQARIAEQKKREEQERQEKEKQQASRGSHTVQPGETLYRISVNIYGSGDGVEKIKRANGLSSNEISVGQTLIIP